MTLETMRECGLEPMVTLHHFTNPRWFAAMGAWQNPSAVRLFGRYAARVVSEYKDLCRLWITINEPVIAIYEGHLLHRWPPGKGTFLSGMATLGDMVRAHGRAYHRIHDFRAGAQVGIAHNLRLFDPANPRSLLDRAVSTAEDYLLNRMLLWTLLDGYMRFPLGLGQYVREVDESLDFIGVNYYARDMVACTLRSPTMLLARNFAQPGAPTDAFGWEIYPEGLYRWLVDLVRFGKPLYVTENGLADKTDACRPAYITRAVAAMWRAIQEGAPVRGYFHWTLMDNFEWAEGYSVPFGLVSVDRETQERRVKASGLVYREICRANGVPRRLLEMTEEGVDSPSSKRNAATG